MLSPNRHNIHQVYFLKCKIYNLAGSIPVQENSPTDSRSADSVTPVTKRLVLTPKKKQHVDRKKRRQTVAGSRPAKKDDPEPANKKLRVPKKTEHNPVEEPKTEETKDKSVKKKAGETKPETEGKETEETKKPEEQKKLPKVPLFNEPTKTVRVLKRRIEKIVVLNLGIPNG